MPKNLIKYIIITRPVAVNDTLKKYLEMIGLNVFNAPSITIRKNLSYKTIKTHLEHIEKYDWILFTSSNGVRFFMDAIQTIEGNSPAVQKIPLAAVGSRTANTARKYNLNVQFIPAQFTTDDLLKEIPNINGKRILFPRSNIANPTVKKQLEINGALVTDLPIYKTEYTTEHVTELERLVQQDQISYITFTSPSTVKGFLRSLEKSAVRKNVFSLPIISIGPVTTDIAKQVGFTHVYTADTHTVVGMVTKLKECIYNRSAVHV